MAGLNKMSEGAGVAKPVGGIGDVAAPGHHRVVSLTAEIGGVDRRAGKVFLQMLSELGQVAGGARDSVEPDHDEVRLLRASRQPAAIGKAVTVKGGVGRLGERGGWTNGGHGGHRRTGQVEAGGLRDPGLPEKTGPSNKPESVSSERSGATVLGRRRDRLFERGRRPGV